MRALVLVLAALLAAGCATPPEAPAAQATPTSEATTPRPGAPGGESAAEELDTTPFSSTLYMAPGYALTPERPQSESAEPERVDPAAFFTMQLAQAPAWSPWAGPPLTTALEVLGDVTLHVRLRADQPATQTTPKALGFPGAGGWIGTTESRNLFFLMQDAPERLEPGQTYSARATITMPRGGMLIAPGEAFSHHAWLAYRTADGSPVQYVLGGDDPASISGSVRRVAWPASLTPIEVLSESGEMGPHPGFTTAGNPDAVELPLSLPENTFYLVVETSGAPRGAGHADLDVDVRKGGETILGGHGPTTEERVVIGPGNLAAYGRELSLYLSSASAAGNTWSVKATAYVTPPDADAAPAS